MYYFYLFFFFFLISGCIEEQEKINLSITNDPEIKEEQDTIKVAIASVISPKESYVYHHDLIKYISNKLEKPVTIVQRRSYQEVNDLMEKNEIDFAFVCSGAYIEGNSKFGMRLLVVPRMYDRTTYHSYIIVPKNSNVSEITDLHNKKFAFSDPLSNSGYIYPVYRLSLINETPESFFGKDEKGINRSFYTYSHDNSIIAVAEELADGAAVDSLVYENMKKSKPDIISRTKIIEVSPPFGIPPVVVRKNINPFLEQRLKFIFTNMHNEEEGEEILSRILIDRFVNINDNAYDSIREMRNRSNE